MSRLSCVLGVLILSVVIDQVKSQTCPPNQCPASFFNEHIVPQPTSDCYDIGEQVTLTCSGDPSGPTSNTCQGTGGPTEGWMFPSATCEVFTCTRPTAGSNLNLTPDKPIYNARELIVYTCDQGYLLTGPNDAICDAQDEWNPSTTPVCIVTCTAPNIANGGLDSGGPFIDGSTATVVCEDGFTVGAGSSSTITCVGGSWDDVPECFQSCNVIGVPNSDVDSDQVIQHGATLTITCDVGYSFDRQTSFTIQCGDSALIGTVPTACYRDCDALQSPTNGAISGGNLHEETVTYSCDRGYLLNDTETDTCNNGTWINGGEVPICYSKSLEDSITLYCNPDKYIVEIPGELLGDNFDLNSVTMGGCTGTAIDGGYLYVNSSYNDCDTVMEIDAVEEMVYYRNLVTKADSGTVTTEESINIYVECVFNQNNRVSSSAVVQSTLTKDLSSSGTYELLFAAYSDANHQNELDSSVTVDTNDEIYLLAQVNYVTDIDLFGSRCYATPSPEEDFHLFYDLIIDGCAVSEYVSGITDNEVTNPNFAFALRVFRFTGSGSDSIYVHCDLKICRVGDCPVPSEADCTLTRRKRYTHISFSKHVFAGPIKMRSLRESESTSDGAWQFTALTVYSATVSALLLIAFAIVGLITYHRRRQPRPKMDGGIF